VKKAAAALSGFLTALLILFSLDTARNVDKNQPDLQERQLTFLPPASCWGFSFRYSFVFGLGSFPWGRYI
jgi:hypothetical protein